MYCREWRATCPKHHEQSFIDYLHQTGIKETSETLGFRGTQILTRKINDKIEITLNTYWTDLDSIVAFAGEDIDKARLYPEDEKFELEPNDYVTHYKVLQNNWV